MANLIDHQSFRISELEADRDYLQRENEELRERWRALRERIPAKHAEVYRVLDDLERSPRSQQQENEKVSERKKIVCVDFDGVLHSYVSGWQGVDVIPDPPVEGAIEWMREMISDPRLSVHVYSARSADVGGRVAMYRWLRANGISRDEGLRITFSVQKPPAHLTIDDRAFCFRGHFPSPDAICNFRTWQQTGEDQ